MCDPKWPSRGDQLLILRTGHGFPQASDERTYRLLRGYKQAGDRLVEAAEADFADRRNLIFPALFNYRHFIELAMKDLVGRHGRWAGVFLSNERHNLSRLWLQAERVIRHFCSDHDDEALVAVGECIAEFSQLDPDATTFRYADSVKGQLNPLPARDVDLSNLRAVMDGLDIFFECLDQHIVDCTTGELSVAGGDRA